MYPRQITMLHPEVLMAYWTDYFSPRSSVLLGDDMVVVVHILFGKSFKTHNKVTGSEQFIALRPQRASQPACCLEGYRKQNRTQPLSRRRSTIQLVVQLLLQFCCNKSSWRKVAITECRNIFDAARVTQTRTKFCFSQR